MQEIRSGNTALADCKAHLDPRSHTGECIPFTLDPALPDHAWALYIDGRRIGAIHPITESVIRDVRKALEKAGDHEPIALAPDWEAPTRMRSYEEKVPLVVPIDGKQATFGF